MRSEGWKEVALSEVIEFNPRENLKKGTMAQKVSMADIEPFTRKVQRSSLEKYSSGSKFRNGDTLLARITPCLENGKTAYVDFLEEDEVAFGSTEFFVLREKKGISDKKFIYYLAISPQLRSIAINSMTGTSGRQRAQIDVLEKARFLLPPLVEQKKIASILSSLDEKIELNHQINQNLEEMAQAIFKSWFIDFEPFQDGEFVESELGMIPKGWEVKSLDEIAHYLNGLAMQKYRPTTEDYLPVIKIKELRQGFTTSDSDKATNQLDTNYIVNDGDVLFSWSGTLEVKIWCGGKGALNQHLFKVTSKEYEKWFYYYWIKFHLERFRRIAEDRATTLGHIRRKDLSDSKVLIPDRESLQKLSSMIKPIFDQIITLKIQSRKLKKVRDTLLPKLMSGEIRVPLEENVTV